MSQHIYRFLAKFEAPNLWKIEGDEFFHLSKVLRLKIGDEIEVFCDSCDATAQISAIEKEKNLALAHSVEVKPIVAPTPKIGIAISYLKPSLEFESVLPALVELGAHEIHLYPSEHSPKKYYEQPKWDRIEQIKLSALKQCKRRYIPKIYIYKNSDEFIQKAKLQPQRILLDTHSKKHLIQAELKINEDVMLILGAESGIDKNIQELAHSCYHLGDAILRASTASISALSIITGLMHA